MVYISVLYICSDDLLRKLIQVAGSPLASCQSRRPDERRTGLGLLIRGLFGAYEAGARPALSAISVGRMQLTVLGSRRSA